MRKLSAIFIFLVITVATVYAQTDSSGFFVQSFKKLDWDLDARSNHPMLDQNSRRAALIKVVIPEAGFDFDVGVMGVVGVRQEVGEVWVYVPEGVRKITIRHQTYGVIRDYEFGCPIESAAVYELRLHVPLKPKVMIVVKDSIIVKDSIVYVPTPVYVKAQRESIREWFNVRKRTRWSVLAVSNVPEPSFGFMATWHAHKVGAYIKAAGKLRRSGADYNIVDVLGGFDSSTETEAWNGHFTRLSVTIGGIFKCTNWLGISTGFGYSQNILDCSSYNGKVYDYYFGKGFSFDLGTIVRFGHLSAYIGGNHGVLCYYRDYSHFDWGNKYIEFGIGYSF